MIRFAHLILGLVVLCTAYAAPVRAEPVVVFAAASLKTALDSVAARSSETLGWPVVVSYGGSSALARQIQHGAPADIFISANPEWMDVLEAGGHVDAGSRRDLLTNTLVLVQHVLGRQESGLAAEPRLLDNGADVAGMIGTQRVAMAFVDAVPAGMYGKAALRSLGIWDGVSRQVVQTDNVRAALALATLGETPFAIVYGTDAMASDRVQAVGRFAPSLHPPIVYPAAVLTRGRTDGARQTLDALAGQAARAVFRAHGFGPQGE